MSLDDLKKLAGEIAEETDGACSYARQALDNKAGAPDVSKIFSQMAEQEAGHAQSLYRIGGMMMDADPEKSRYGMAWGLVGDMLRDGLIKYRAVAELLK